MFRLLQCWSILCNNSSRFLYLGIPMESSTIKLKNSFTITLVSLAIIIQTCSNKLQNTLPDMSFAIAEFLHGRTTYIFGTSFPTITYQKCTRWSNRLSSLASWNSEKQFNFNPQQNADTKLLQSLEKLNISSDNSETTHTHTQERYYTHNIIPTRRRI